jgi:hypothetical protein
MKTLIRLFVITLGLIAFAASSAWAEGLTIPNTFTAGTKAVASKVNANFSAVAAALPMVWASTDETLGGQAVSASGRVVTNSLSINVPSDGFLVISGSAFVNNYEPATVTYTVNPLLDGSDVTASAYVMATFTLLTSPPNMGGNSYTITVPVTAGAHTVEQEVGPFSGTADFFYNGYSLTVVFFPGSQGTYTPLSSWAVEALPGESIESETGE